MTEQPLFAGAKLKLRRALHHAEQLDRLLDDHYTQHAVKFEGTPPVNLLTNAGKPITGKVSVKEAPEESAAILGDAIHNARSALDLMAVDLVRATKDAAGNPGNTKAVYFPFCEVPADLDMMIKKRNFHRAGPDAIALLKTFQPYTNGNRLLRLLHDFDIQDKHHAVIPVIAQAKIELQVAMIDGAPHARIVAASTRPPIVFPADSICAGDLVFDTLKDQVQLVDGIIKAFEALVAARP